MSGPPLGLENLDQILGSWDLCFDFPCGLKSWEYVKEGSSHEGRWGAAAPDPHWVLAEAGSS